MQARAKPKPKTMVAVLDGVNDGRRRKLDHENDRLIQAMQLLATKDGGKSEEEEEEDEV